MWWLIETGLWSFKGMVILCVIGFVYQIIKTQRDKKLYPPPGKMIDVGGYRLHINVQGEGKPAVVLDSGLGCSSLNWALVQPKLSESNLVCSYDRAGMGWSEESPNKRTCQNMVDELHTLLHKAAIPSPYILVGHSLGGVNVRLFASKFPSEVAGIVLVDAAHEDQVERLPPPPAQNKLVKLLSSHHFLQFIANIGVMRFLLSLPPVQKMYEMFPESTKKALLATRSTSKCIRASLQEASCLNESLKQLKSSSSNFGNQPLVVITAGKVPMSKETGCSQEWIDGQAKVWRELQKELVSKSENSKQLIAENSDHNIPHHQPAIIINAVFEMKQKMLSASLNQNLSLSGATTQSLRTK